MDRVKWIEAKGKKILYTDFSGLNTIEEQISVLNEQKELSTCCLASFWEYQILPEPRAHLNS